MDRQIVRRTLEALAVVACVAIETPSWAHHSMVAYQSGAAGFSIEGVITEVRWTNPHMFVIVAVTAADGTTQIWSCEGAGVTAAINAGISPRNLKAGARVKVIGGRHLDETKHLMLFQSVEIDGKLYNRNGQINRPSVGQ